jgi:hypothetical protein
VLAHTCSTFPILAMVARSSLQFMLARMHVAGVTPLVIVSRDLARLPEPLTGCVL